jgi:murein DD-endopeptidase MepM/ murein hydrolase activator NlpD
MQNRSPVLQRPNKGKSSAEYLQELEALMKRNKGGMTLVGEDVGFNTPYSLANAVPNTPPALQGGLSNYQQPNPTKQNRPIPQELPPYEPPPEDTGDEGEGDEYGDELPENPTIEQFLDVINNSVNPTQQPSTQQMESVYQQTGKAYPLASMQDGSVLYSDGSYRSAQEVQRNPLAIASLEGNRVLYDDGIVRNGDYIDEEATQAVAEYGGVAGLSQMIFGQQQAVTQEFGVKGIHARGHRGVDFRTRDLTNREIRPSLNGEVVQVLYDDGTRFGTYSGHQGYGNSVLIRLSTGEYVRLSHLSSVAVQPGQAIRPGDLIGTPGSTGNSTAEHMDVEVLDQNGRVMDPNKLNYQIRQNREQYVSQDERPQPGQISDQYSPSNQQLFSSQPQQRQQMQQPASQQMQQQRQETMLPRPIVEKTAQAFQNIQEIPEAMRMVAEPMSPERQAGGEFINQTGQVLGLGTDKGFLGTGEDFAGNTQAAIQERERSIASGTLGQTNPLRYLAGNVTEKVGDRLGFIEGKSSEAIAGAPTRRTNLAEAATPEFQQMPRPFQDQYEQTIKGDVQRATPQIKNLSAKANQVTNPFNLLTSGLQKAGSFVANQAQQSMNTRKQAAQNVSNVFAKRVQNPVSAQPTQGMPNPESALAKIMNQKDQQTPDASAQPVINQPGQGLSDLKGQYQGVSEQDSNIFKQKALDTFGKKAIGEDSSNSEASNMLPTSLLDLNKVGAENDNRDAFFKAGGAQAYKDYLNPGVTEKYKGALDLNLFNAKTFDDPNAIANIFGSTFLGKAATDIYRGREAAKYPKMGYGEYGYDGDYRNAVDSYNREIDKYISSIPSVFTSGFKFEAPAKSSVMRPTGPVSQKASVQAPPKNFIPLVAPVLSSLPVPGKQMIQPLAKAASIAQNIFAAQKPTAAVKAPSISRPSSGPAQPSKPSVNVFSNAVKSVISAPAKVAANPVSIASKIVNLPKISTPTISKPAVQSAVKSVAKAVSNPGNTLFKAITKAVSKKR